MDGYCAYILGDDGHISMRIDIETDSEEYAIERAKALVDGHAVELWQGDHKIAMFEPD